MRVARGLPYGLLALLLAAVALRGGMTTGAAPLLQLAVAGLALTAACSPALRAAPRDALAVAIAWSALGLAQVAWSADPDAALDGAAAVLASALIFLVAATAVSDNGRWRVMAAFSTLGAVVAGLAVAAASPGVRASFPLGNPDHLAGWLLLPGMIAFAGMFHAEATGKGRSWTVVWFGVLGVVSAGIAATGSRGAALAAAGAAGALLVLRRAGVRRGSLMVAAGLGAVALALAVLPVLRPGLVPAVGDGLLRSAGIRWQVYEASARAAMDAAPTGVGLGGYSAAFTAHRPNDLPYSPRFAHNETLHGVVELGIPFLVAVIATVLLFARRAARGAGATEPRALVSWGAAGALLAALAHAQIDFALRIPAIALAAATLAGFAWREFDGPRPASSPRWSRGALAGLAAALVGLAGTQSLATLAEVRSQAHLVAGDFGAAEEEAQRGLRMRPQRVALLRRSAEAAEHAFELGGGGRGALERAVRARTAAAAASRQRADVQVELAAVLWKSGARVRALTALDRAVDLDPASPGLRVMRSRLLLADARRRDAALALRDALERHPVAALDAVEALLRATDDPQLAQTAVPAIPRAIVGAGRALVRAGYPRDAAEQFQRALALQPADPKLALETARSLRAAGDPGGATAVLSRTLDLVPGDARLVRALERMRVRAERARDLDSGGSPT